MVHTIQGAVYFLFVFFSCIKINLIFDTQFLGLRSSKFDCGGTISDFNSNILKDLSSINTLLKYMLELHFRV